MATSAALALSELVSRLHEQTLDVANLRTALDVQMNRISHQGVKLDVLTPQRRKSLRALLVQQPSYHGNPQRRFSRRQ